LLDTKPRLAVGTHFPTEDDTAYDALDDIRVYYPRGEVVVASDLMVLSVTKERIDVRRAIVSDYTWTPSDPAISAATFDTPRYWTWEVDDHGNYVLDGNGNKIPVGNPYAQLDPNADTIDQNLWDT
jgi:hypothetical protein